MSHLYRNFISLKKSIGCYNAVRLVLLTKYLTSIKKEDWNIVFNKEVNRFLKKNFSGILDKYKTCNLSQVSYSSLDTIWVFWWQGASSMPSVIKECYNSVLRNAKGYKVILLSKDNIFDYIKLPVNILEKFNNNIISFTHFSDIVRIILLNLYGGLWIDAAIFVTSPINIGSPLFFSPKMRESNSLAPHLSKWVIGVMASQPNNPLLLYMEDMLFVYWKKFNGPFHYLMFDYMLRFGYENNPLFNSIIESLPVTSPDIHSSRYTFNQEVDYSHLEFLLNNNQFLSLTYRINYPMLTKDGKETYYSVLINRYK